MYYRESFATRAQAKATVVEFIASYYNRRPHSSAEYQVSVQLMEAFFERNRL